MAGPTRGDASIKEFFQPAPHTANTRASSYSLANPDAPVGDGFTEEEIKDALRPKPIESWQPTMDYTECEIRELRPGPRAVTFMGRVANLFDVPNTPKTPKSAKGCIKLCVKDNKGAITVRLCNGENGTLSSPTAPLFASLFPERDSSCHLMVHEKSDDGNMYIKPIGYREGRQLNGVMTLQNFADGGHDVADAKILVVVRNIGAKKTVTRKDKSIVENVNVQVQDDTALATIGLWGTCALSPFAPTQTMNNDGTLQIVSSSKLGWKAGETVLLVKAPGWKVGRSTYLHLTTSTMVDVDPQIPDVDWLRRWALRQKKKESINPPFPEGVFNLRAILSGPVRCLYTFAELDEFARAAPTETFHGFLSLILMDLKLLECQRRQMLMCGECCDVVLYANAVSSKCSQCESDVVLRFNPKIIGQVMDETAEMSSGKLLFSDWAWIDLFGRGPEDLLEMGPTELKYLTDRLLFCRLTIIFGWTGDESKAGGRICVMAIQS